MSWCGVAALSVVTGCKARAASSESWSSWSTDSATTKVDSAGGAVAPAQPAPAPAATESARTNAAASPQPSVPRVEPALPRAYVDTRYVPPTGRRIAVRRGGDLQQALEAAQPGDLILLDAGATFIGNFTLPAKTGAGWITVRSSAPDRLLPPEGTRLTPSFSAAMPKIVTPNIDPALRTAQGAHHYRIIGVEFSVDPSVKLNYGIVTFGEGPRPQRDLDRIPSGIILDRSYVHGHPQLNVRRCVALNSAWSAVIDSYLSECHAKGFDSQAICGWNGPGPFKIVNNYLEGAGEIVMFGGADPSIRNLTPSDIEIRRNHFSRPTAWKGVWTVKNLFELKHAQRVLVEGNVLENHWVDAQGGFAIVWFSVNQQGSAPWSVVRDVTFRYNKLRNASAGINIASGQPMAPASRMKIVDNLLEKINVAPFSGPGRAFQVLGGLDNVTIEHNTTFTNNAVVVFDGLPQRTNFDFSNNLTTRGEYGIAGSDVGEGLKALDYYLAPGYRAERNVFIGPGNDVGYPAKNFFPKTIADVGFVNVAAGNYRLSARSRYRRAGADGRDPGANVDSIEAATRGVVLP
ncbi:MAG TPA: hypothetical protein VIF32_00830 [Gemmatimonadaceae bacterium]